MADLPPGPRLPAVLQGALAAHEPYDWMLRRWPRVRHVIAVPGPGARAVLQGRLPSGARRAPLGAAA